ncbi:RNAPII degradation factor [Coemansia sp. RSA 2131]|nr:RNAPII degradation factor [Coemansia sp. RSA 2131]
MSTIPSNTQANMRGKGSRGTRSDEAGSIKALKELFSEWTEEDLLSAFKEANSDLEKTIDYITEGHATQWGEVKSRKKQPGAKQQKPKQHYRDEPKTADKSTNVPRPASFRGGVRGGAARGRGGYMNTTGARGRPVQTKPVAAIDSAAGWDITPSSDAKSTDNWATDAETSDKPVAAASVPSSNGTAAPAKLAPVSWASIAKRGVKQAPVEPAKAAEGDAPKTKSIEEESVAETTEPAVTKVEVVEEVVTEDGSVKVEETVIAEVVQESAQPDSSVDQPTEPAAQPVQAEETQAAPSPKKPAPNARRLHQDAPVVMPLGKSTLERIGVQFGSLSIGGVELGSVKEAEASPTAVQAPEPPLNEPVQVEAQKPAPVAAAPAPKADAAPALASVAVAEPAAASAAAQGPLTTYLQQQQQQQASQAHPTASAASIGQMPLPNDYGAAALYGAEAQRSMMGFYDNYGYGQFVANKDSVPASSADPQPSTTVPQAVGANGTNLNQAGLFPQMPQPFGMNHGMPYYNPYYYNMMQPGGQYNPAFGNNPALAAAYGQPFMKQGMYPMYPGTTPQGLQAGSQPQPAQQTQQPNAQPAAQPQQPVMQQPSVKGSVAGAQNNASAYGNIAQKAGNPYGHYSANIGSGFGMYEQEQALSNSPQQFGLGGIPNILASKTGKDAGKGIHPAGTAPVIGGTTYYSAPQQQPQQQHQQQHQQQGYPSQSNAAPQAYNQQYYNPYVNYAQSQAPHMYQQPHPQSGQQPNKQYWEKQ